MDKLNQALAGEFWLDATRLSPDKGAKVFAACGAALAAVTKLMASDAEIRGMGAIVARAAYAITAAQLKLGVSASLPAKDIAKAREIVGKGTELEALEAYKKAVSKFGAAWKKIANTD